MLYWNKFLVSEWIFELVCHSGSCRLSEIGCTIAVRDVAERNIAETSLNRLLLLLLILKSSHWSFSVEKGVLKHFTGKHLC